MEQEEYSEYSAAHLERCAKAGQAWGSEPVSGKGAAAQWWKEKHYHLGSVDVTQARIDSDWQRLQCGPGRDKSIWTPQMGAFVATVTLVPDDEKRAIRCPEFYYQISRILLHQAGRWSESYVI